MLQPIRFTIDELSAVGCLRGIPEGPRVSKAVELVESGTRSLLARNMLHWEPDSGRLMITEIMQAFITVVTQGTQFLVLGRNPHDPGQHPGLSGRVIVAPQDQFLGELAGRILVEEEAYPGVFEYGGIDPCDLASYLRNLYSLPPQVDEPTYSQPRVDTDATVTIHIPAEGSDAPASPHLPQEWTDPVINTVLLVTEPEPAVAPIMTWVAEGGRCWALEAGSDDSQVNALQARLSAAEVIASQLDGLVAALLGSQSDAA